MHNLIELQKSDTEINLIHQKKKELPRKIAELDEQFSERSRKLQESRDKLDNANKGHKEREDGLKKGAETLKKTKERLTGPFRSQLNGVIILNYTPRLADSRFLFKIIDISDNFRVNTA